MRVMLPALACALLLATLPAAASQPCSGSPGPCAVTQVLSFSPSIYDSCFLPVVTPSGVVVIACMGGFRDAGQVDPDAGVVLGVEGVTGKTRWSMDLPSYTVPYTGPHFLSKGNAIAIPAPPGVLVLDGNTGAVVGNFTTPCGSGLLVSADSGASGMALYTCQRSSVTYAMNLTAGTINWTFDANLDSRLILWSDTAVILHPNCDGTPAPCPVSALSYADGRSVWSVTLPAGPSIYFLSSYRVLFMGEFTQGNSSLGAYNPHTGALWWSVAIMCYPGEHAYNDDVLVTYFNNNLYAYGLRQEGALVWWASYNTAWPYPVAISPAGVLFVGLQAEGDWYMGVDITTGAPVWNMTSTLTPQAGDAVQPTLDSYGNLILQPFPEDGPLNLTCLSAKTGGVLWSFTLQGSGIVQPRDEVGTVVGKGFVYVTFDGGVYGFAAQV